MFWFGQLTSLLLGCRPNVGGVVGLADLYVDPALGFSLGWAAWVSSSYQCYRQQTQGCADGSFPVQLERNSAYVGLRIRQHLCHLNLFTATEITAAALVIGYWDKNSQAQ